MSFGFGLGDFVTLSALTVSLYRSFKNAPGEFSEISRQLESLHVVIADLRDQAKNQHSPFNQNGTARGPELSEIRGNLLETMKELEDLHKRYQKMGRISWSRFELGQKDLAALRSKLTVQISTLNAFMGSLAVAALGRMEPMLRRIHDILDEQVKRSMTAAESVLSASEDQDEGWNRLELGLRTEGIPLDYIQKNREGIKTVLCSVVESNHLAGNASDHEAMVSADPGVTEDDGISPADSASQIWEFKRAPRTTTKDRRLSIRRKSTESSKERVLTAEEEQTRVLIMNSTGFDVRRGRQPGVFARLSHKLQKDLHIRGGNTVFGGRIHTEEANAVCFFATYTDSIKPLKLLLESGCRPTMYSEEMLNKISSLVDSSALSLAARAQQWGNVKLLIEHGARLDQPRLIHMAALADESEVISLLVKRGVSVNALAKFEDDDEDALCEVESIYKSDGSSATRRWGWGEVESSNDRWTALHYAAYFAYETSIAVLLEHGAKVNAATTACRLKPLHLAIAGSAENSAEVVRILVGHGAEINAMDGDLDTPLHIAVGKGDQGSVDFLCMHGAHINAKNKSGLTPLHVASAKRDLGNLSLGSLVDRGAHLDAQNVKGETPLHIAVKEDNKVTAKFLLSRGAKCDIEDEEGATARWLARYTRNEELFRQKGSG